GCGYGNFLYFLKTWGYKNVFGIDVSSEEVKLCRELFPQYSIEQADIVEYLSKTKEKFEAIYLSHVLEHIKKDEVFEFLEKIKGAMSDSGYLIIVVPNSSAYFNALATRYGDLTHEIGYSENNILQLLRVAGFSRVSIRNFNGVGTFWLNIVRKFLMTCFELFIQALGYDKQSIHTPSMLVIVQK
ncbi:MAG: class I SAM-dependent methyltransferase, partial [Candidatus Andersenbacteria bacterium]